MRHRMSGSESEGVRLVSTAFSLISKVPDLLRMGSNFLLNIVAFDLKNYLRKISIISDKRHRRLGKIVKESDERRVSDLITSECFQTILQYKAHLHNIQSLSSLMWLVSIFVATWCTCMLSQVIVSWMEPSEVTIVAETYAVRTN